MKILIIGGTGTIGKKVSDHLSKKHEIIIGGRESGDVKVDIANSKSIEALFESVGKIDAIVCIAGEAKWASFDSMSKVINGYVKSVEGKGTGEIIRIYDNC